MNENIFDGIGETYAKYRPSYSQELLKYFYSEIGINKSSIIADIGSGTGILTRQLLNKCSKIYAVEPNSDMRKVAERNLGNDCRFISVNGTAENTTLESNSIDYITAAQSFHWFNRLIFKQECKRILRPKGNVILIWNSRDENSELVRKIDFINQKYCPNFSGSACGMRGAKTPNDFDDFFCQEYTSSCFQNNLKFTIDEFIGLHLSASYRLDVNDSNYLRYINELTEIFNLYNINGILEMPNLTRCYVGTV